MPDDDGDDNEETPSSPSFADRADAARALEEDVGDQDAPVLIEGQLAKGGGRLGTKKGKAQYFRLQSHLIVYYNVAKGQNGGATYKGKPQGEIPQELVLYADTVNSDRMQAHKAPVDAANTFVIVCTSRLFRLTADTPQLCEKWVQTINEHIVGDPNVLAASKLSKQRGVDALEALGRGLRLNKKMDRTVQMLLYLEDEVFENQKMAAVLRQVEQPAATGSDSDLKASELTNAAYDKMTMVMQGIRGTFDVDAMIASFSEAGIEAHAPPPPRIQTAFKEEYSRCVDLVFKDDPAAKSGRAGLDAEDAEELFHSDLVHEEACELDHALKSKRRISVVLKMYKDSIAWHAVDNKGRVSTNSTGKFALRCVLHCDAINKTTLKITHFDESKSQYCFCKDSATVHKLIDEISHVILDYNKTDVSTLKAAYMDKETQVRDGIAICRKAVRKLSKKEQDGASSLWQLLMEYLEEYVSTLFERLKAARRDSNELRLHVGSNNPHLATRRVAADLDEAINTMALVRAGVKTLPLMSDYLSELVQQQQAADKIMDMMTDDTLGYLKDIDDMLENELAEEEDTTVSAMLIGGYGHDDDTDEQGNADAYVSSHSEDDGEDE